MTQVPLPGEQSALRGYRWQYDHASRLVYDAIVDGDFDRLVLASTDAGQLDDLLLFLRGRRAAYQFKGGVSRATISLSELVRSGKTPAGHPTDSLWRALATAWLRLSPGDDRPLTVHLSMAATYSTADHSTEGPNRPSPDHFRAFAARALEPLMAGTKTFDDLPEWSVPLQRLLDASRLSKDEFTRFLPSVRLELGLSEALDGADGSRSDDLRSLSDALLREVSHASGPVELTRDEVLALVNWSNRTSFRSVHEFPVNGATYSPLTGAVALLHRELDNAVSGYLAVTGAPGAGKSTLLSQSLSGLTDRVVRYYAFVPGGGGNARNRLSAEWFLHDLSTMLRDSGLHTAQKRLTSRTVHDLRQSIHEQFDAASEDYLANGRRTIVVVDGLDHVHRDYSGNDALTAELPSPAELPPGLIFIVGTRDLSPLRSEARQYIEDAGTEVNLEKQRLQKSAVVQVCERFEATRTLPRSVHELIANRSAGHPLALVYLLARVGDYVGDDPVGFVASVPQYDGDIAMLYRAAWDALDADGELERVLRICSRLRTGFDLDWMRTWTTDSTTRLFRTQLRYLFRIERGRWRFFHDSFRQFARERTSIGDDRAPDDTVDREAHAEVAAICESSANPVFVTQAIFHRFQAGDLDGVLRLGTQELFRRQFRELRAATAIADDAKLVMTAAAQTGDLVGLLRGLLILSEISDKSSEIEDVDVCRVLVRAGRIEDAIDYVGDEQALRVPLSQAYNLAADLATQNNAAGERIFALFNHFGLEQPGGARGVRTDSDIAEGWARCAAHFLPIDTALSRMRTVLPTVIGERDWEFSRSYALFGELLTAYVDELGVTSPANVSTIDTALLEEVRLLARKAVPEQSLSRLTALLVSMRVHVHAVSLLEQGSFEDRVASFKHFRESLKGLPAGQTTLLDIAILEAEYGSADRALTTLMRTSFDRALTLSELGASGADDAIANHYEYWRLRHELEIGLGVWPSYFGAGPISSTPAAAATPAGNDVASSAPLHRDTEAIELADRIDSLVRHMAFAHALISNGIEVGEDEAWEAISVVINLFPPTARRQPGHSLHSLRSKRPELHHIAIEVLNTISPRLVSRYGQAVSRRFVVQPEEWHVSLQVSLGIRLTTVGVASPWLTESLKSFESQATEQGVNGALVDLVALVDAYADLGMTEEAERVCMQLWRTAFGLGSQNDYQLARWVQWLGRAAPRLANLDDEAAWLTRVLVAAEPLTDQAIGAEHLAEALAPTSPRLALSVFESLVARGAVSHTDAMANLLAALIRAGGHDRETILLASEITTGIIAAAGNKPQPELVETLAHSADRSLLDNLEAELGKTALPTTRTAWVRPLAPTPAPDRPPVGDGGEYGRLELRGGERLSPVDVSARARDISSLRELVDEETASSHFNWLPVLDRNFSEVDAEATAEVFAGSAHEARVLAWAAQREFDQGRAPASQRFAHRALSLSTLSSWSSIRDAVRRDAVRLLVATGAMTATDAAQDFVRFVTEERWYSSMLSTDINDIFDALGADISVPGYWETVREYLAGLSENLALPAPHPEQPTLRWWINVALPGRRSASALTPAQAVAELAAMHLTHPAWAVREGAAQIVVSALRRGSENVACALARLVDTAPTDDVLESVAGCIAAAGSTGAASLDSVRDVIATHRNLLIRRLSAPGMTLHNLRIARPLPAIYRLQLPEDPAQVPDTIFGAEAPFLAPFEDSYALLSRVSGLDFSTVLAVAGRYATDALATLPDTEDAMSALRDAAMTLSNPSSLILSSRTAFGHVLGDLFDSGQIGPLPARVERHLRTGDVAMVGRTNDRMPDLIPSHPPAGHDQTPETWAAGAEARMDEYVRANLAGSDRIVGARSELAILNWPHLEESYSCDLARRGEKRMRTELKVSMLISDLADVSNALTDPDDMPLLLKNHSNAFMERRADWLAFHPRLANLLGWRLAPGSIGDWRTATDRPAAATSIWTNGTWGRHSKMFDDAVSEGCVVTLTPDGLADATGLLGPLDLILTLERTQKGREQPKTTVVRRIEL